MVMAAVANISAWTDTSNASPAASAKLTAHKAKLIP